MTSSTGKRKLSVSHNAQYVNIEHHMKMFFLKNYTQNVVVKLVPQPFLNADHISGSAA